MMDIIEDQLDYEKPLPVQEHQPLTDIDPEIRNMIEGQRGGSTESPQTSGAYLKKRTRDNEMDLKKLTYVGRNPVIQTIYRTCYTLHLKDPIAELEKRRNCIEEKIAGDQRVTDALDDQIRDIERELDGINEEGEVTNKYATRTLMKNAEALVMEYEEALDNEQRLKAEEEVKAEEIKDMFFQEEDSKRKEEIAQDYQAYQKNILQRKDKEKNLKEKLSNVSQRYNLFFDNVERAESFRARYATQKENVIQDKSALEGVSYDLKFLVRVNTGAVRIVQQIADNQKSLEVYRRLVEGLEKIWKTEGEIMRDVPNIIESNRRKTKRQKDEDVGRLNRSKENEIQLAKRRIKEASGLGL